MPKHHLLGTLTFDEVSVKPLGIFDHIVPTFVSVPAAFVTT